MHWKPQRDRNGWRTEPERLGQHLYDDRYIYHNDDDIMMNDGISSFTSFLIGCVCPDALQPPGWEEAIFWVTLKWSTTRRWAWCGPRGPLVMA